MKKMTHKNICCICSNEFEGWGNNAQPVANGQCCDYCNIHKVIPARLKEPRCRDCVEWRKTYKGAKEE